MLAEGMIDKAEAVSRVPPDEVESLLHPQLDESAKTEVIASLHLTELIVCVMSLTPQFRSLLTYS